MKNVVLIHQKHENISKISKAIIEIGENLFISTSLKNGIQFSEFQASDIFIIDGSYPINLDEVKDLKRLGTELIFINRDNLNIEISEFGILVDEDKFLQYLEKSDKEIGSDIASVSVKKAQNIFRDFESFSSSITQEVRRAKRYNYPLVIIMFDFIKTENMPEVIDYFASKIREFDSLWIADSNHFSMILPHTGWNGAEILTNRLTTQITNTLNLSVNSLKNQILNFKRIESDSDFISRITNSLTLEYNNIDNNIDFNIWKDELFSEFVGGKTTRVFNRYKGMLVSHDSDILLKDSKLELSNIRNIQLSLINQEKATYFYSSTLNKTIRASVEKVNLDDSFAVLTNFEIIDTEFIKKTTMKLLIEDNMDISIFDELNNNISGKIVEISLEELTIIVESTSFFKENSNLKATFTLPFSGKQISADIEVKSIEEGKDISYMDLRISTSIVDDMKISEFLSKKQIEFIKELKTL